MLQIRAFGCLSMFAALGAGIALGAPTDTTADAVLGQSTFISATTPAIASATTLQGVRGVAVDARFGRLVVADSGNNRVLGWASASAFKSGEAADLVLGQATFATVLANGGALAPTARTMSDPRSVAFDSGGRLYVADSGNKRVLRFDPPFTSNQAAVQVFGQGDDFTTADQAAVNNATPANLGNPDGIAIDSKDTLYIADRFLSRVSIYLLASTTDTNADLVIGQPDLSSAGFNHGGNPAANTLGMPIAVGVDTSDNLYVADEGNNRVLFFPAPLANNQNATRVFGQLNFTSNAPNNIGISATSLFGPVGVAIDPASGHLFIADAINHRVLEYNTPLTSSTASRVYGQGGVLTTGAPNKGGISADSLNDVAGVALDKAGNLYVGDRLNNRALRYDIAAPPAPAPSNGDNTTDPPPTAPVSLFTCGGPTGLMGAGGAGLLPLTLAGLGLLKRRPR